MVKKFLLLSFSSMALAVLLNACYYDTAEKLYPTNALQNCDTTSVTYSKTIQPILANECLSCHRSTILQGNVNLEGYSNVAIWAKSGKLYNSVAHNGQASPMPKNGSKLSDCKILQIKKWIDAGSPNN